MEQKEVQSLLECVRTGDDEAFSALADAFRPMMESLAVGYGSGLDRVSGEELLQEARLALYRAACTYSTRHGVTFGLYARVCVRNALLSHLRLHRAQTAAVLAHSIDELLLVDEREPVGSLIEAEALSGLQKKIDALLSPYEKTVFDRYVLGERPAVIAASLGKSEKSVCNAVFRIQTKLRKALGK